MQMKTNRHGELLLMVSGSRTNRYFEFDHVCESVDSLAKCCTNRIGNRKELYHTQECIKCAQAED